VRRRPALACDHGGEGERGASVVEFVIVLPFFFVMIFFVAEMSGALKTWLVLENASREGARLAVIYPRPTVDAVRQRVVNTAVNSGLSPSQVTVTYADPARSTGSDVQVSVSHRYTFRTPLVRLVSAVTGGAIPTSMPMTAQTHMRLE